MYSHKIITIKDSAYRYKTSTERCKLSKEKSRTTFNLLYVHQYHHSKSIHHSQLDKEKNMWFCLNTWLKYTWWTIAVTVASGAQSLLIKQYTVLKITLKNNKLWQLIDQHIYLLGYETVMPTMSCVGHLK